MCKRTEPVRGRCSKYPLLYRSTVKCAWGVWAIWIQIDAFANSSPFVVGRTWLRRQTSEKAETRNAAFVFLSVYLEFACLTVCKISPLCVNSKPGSILSCPEKPFDKSKYPCEYRLCVRLRIIIIIDNFCIELFSGVHKLTALYNISNIF